MTMIRFDPCGCGETVAVARLVRDESVALSPDGEVLDRSGSDAIEDLECARCSRTLRKSEDLSTEEVKLLLDGQA
jgi:hypothetical protein